MGFFEAIGSCFRKYFDFSTRARRSEFWNFKIFIFLLYVIIGTSEFCLYYFTLIDEYTLYMIYLIVNTIIGFSLIIPSLAVSVRRLHDINKSGGAIFLNLIPIIGGIILFIYYCKKSFPFENKYGIPHNDVKEEIHEISIEKNDNIKPSNINVTKVRRQPWKD